jgi:hypothetical protein
VEEPLAPFGIAGRRVRSIASHDHARMEAVNVGMMEDDTPPPGPLPLRRLCDEIKKAGSSPEACKCRIMTAMNDLKSQHAVKGDGTCHIVRGQRDSPDALNHCGTKSAEFEASYESRGPSAMSFSANSLCAFSFLVKRVKPMPRSTLGALVN